MLTWLLHVTMGLKYDVRACVHKQINRLCPNYTQTVIFRTDLSSFLHFAVLSILSEYEGYARVYLLALLYARLWMNIQVCFNKPGVLFFKSWNRWFLFYARAFSVHTRVKHFFFSMSGRILWHLLKSYVCVCVCALHMLTFLHTYKCF